MPSNSKQYHLIGVISDTHGLVRPQALRVLEGVELLIHAGDIGAPDVIPALRSIAKVIAVKGNVDKGRWTGRLPERKIVNVGEARLYVLHDLNDLDRDPGLAGFHAVISGHSHQPSVVKRNGVLYLNPGSAGPRRFRLPVSVARLRVRGSSVEAEVVELAV
jgi:putative phosphoesterase